MKLQFYKAREIQVIKGDHIICTHLYGATNLFTQGAGLMFRSLKNGEGMLFDMKRKAPISLHMIAVFMTIDVLFGNLEAQTMKITDIKRDFKPFTMTSSQTPCNAFLELPCGAAKNLQIGDTITFSSPKTI